jgi:hypothetical protein
MPLDFPSNPVNNQSYTVDTRTYVFDGNAWNLSFSPLTALNSISIVDNGGDGSLTYNASSGVFTYTGPTPTEVRSHFTAGSGISIASGSIAVDNTVVRTTGQQLISQKTLDGVTVNRALAMQVHTLTGSALDPNNGPIQIKTLTTPTFFSDSFTNGTSILLMLTGANTWAVTWPSMVWVTDKGNVTPTLTGSDAIVLWKANNTLYGAWVGSSS